MKSLLSILALAASLSLAAPDQTWTQIRVQEYDPTGFADTDSILWISTYLGLLEVDKKTGTKRLHHPRTFGAAFDSVWSIADGGNGVLWMGLHNGSIARYDGKTWTNMPLPSSPGFTLEFVKVAMDHKGILWVHAYQRANYSNASPGLFTYDGKAWTTLSQGSMPPNPSNSGLSRSPWAMSLDTAGHVWIVSAAGFYEYAGGVLYLEDGRWNTITASPTGLLTNMNDCITMDADGDIWIGGPKGVSILDFGSMGGLKPALRSSEYLKLISVPGGIHFTLDRPGGIRVQAVDGRGKSVLERNSTESAGRHFLPIQARPGVLYLKLSAQEESAAIRHLVE